MHLVRNGFWYPMLSPLIEAFLVVGIITMGTGAMQFLQEEAQRKARPISASSVSGNVRLAALRKQEEKLLGELERLPSPDQLPDVDLQALEAARQHLLKQLAKLREEIAPLQAALVEKRQAQGQVDQKQQQLLEELKHLEQQIRELEAQLEKLRYDRRQIEQLKKKLAELLQRLEEAGRRYQDLQEKIAAEKAKQVEEGFRVEVHPRVHMPQGLQREIVVIHQATITPVCEPYFEQLFVPVGKPPVAMQVAVLKQRGPATAEALRPGSEIMQWIDKLDPQRQYVFLFVDAASFETFRAVRALLQKRGIMCGWEPANDVEVLGSGLQGGRSVRTSVQ